MHAELAARRGDPAVKMCSFRLPREQNLAFKNLAES
jgi:hypothetical protein